MHNPSPADLYFYALPLGTALPPDITPSCSACTKSVMALYAEKGTNLTALEGVYGNAAKVANQACGQGYVQVTSVNGARSVLHAWRGSSLFWVLGVAGVLVFW